MLSTLKSCRQNDEQFNRNSKYSEQCLFEIKQIINFRNAFFGIRKHFEFLRQNKCDRFAVWGYA